MASGLRIESPYLTDAVYRSQVRREAIGVVLGSIAFALIFGGPLLEQFFRLGLANDWDYHMELHWVPFYTVTHFHQFPLWNPYKCGGMPMLGNPQSRILTPFFLLHLLFGPLVGLHLEIIAHIAIAFSGAYVLARVLGISKLGAIACAGTFAGSSWYYLHMAVGHTTFIGAAYIPWIIALFRLACARRRLTLAAAAGFFTALIFLEGGIYPAAYCGLLLFIVSLITALERRSAFPMLALATAGALTIAFAAPKLLPMFRLTGASGRWVDPFETNTLSMFFQELLSRNQNFPRSLPGGFWGFWEYGAYIGVFFAGLAFLGIVLSFRRALPWLIASLFLLGLAAGNYGPYSPWVLLHRLPIFAAEHAPTRLLLLVTLTVGILAGLGAEALSTIKKPWGTCIAATILLFGLIDCWLVSARNLRYVFGGDQTAFAQSATFHQFYDPNDHHMYMMAKANLGAIGCYEPASPGTHAYASNRPGYAGEQYLLWGQGQVSIAQWTPNALTYKVDAITPAAIVVNQNFDPAWRIARGQGHLYSEDGLLAVRVPAGKQELTLDYRDTTVFWGFMIFALALVAAGAFWAMGPHRPLREELKEAYSDLGGFASGCAARASSLISSPSAYFAHHGEPAFSSGYEAILVAVASTAFALWFCYPILLSFSTEGVLNDWDQHIQLLWVPLHTIVHFHQFPLWDPYKCGGIPLLADPQSPFFTPFFLLDLVFGTAIGLHLGIIGHLALAFAGAYFLARVLGISGLGSVACGCSFAGSSWYYIHLAAGHGVFVSYTYVPWIVGLFYLSCERKRAIFSAIAGALIALIFMEGGIYASPQTGFVLTLLAGMLALQRRSFVPLPMLAVAGSFAFGFAAIKLLPSIAFVGLHIRPIDPGEVNRAGLFIIELFSRNQDPGRVLEGQPWGFHEHGAYIGVFIGALALLGIALRFGRAYPWLILSLVVLALARGYFGPFSPWVLVHKLPFFSSHRVPTRWLVLVPLFAGVLAGFGIDALSDTKRPWGIIIATLLVGLVLADDWTVSSSYLNAVVGAPDDSLAASANFRQINEAGYFHHMVKAAKGNLGVLQCYDEASLQRHAVGYDQPGYRGEQYMLGAGTATLTHWTPNRLSFEVDAPSATVMVVNQNYDPSWRLVEGQGELGSHDGLIAVRVPAGRQHIELAYRSYLFVIGLVVTLVTSLAALLLWRYEPRSDRS